MINATETLKEVVLSFEPTDGRPKVTEESFNEVNEKAPGFHKVIHKAMNKHACNVLDELRKRVDEVDTNYIVNFKAAVISNMNDIKKELCAE